MLHESTLLLVEICFTLLTTALLVAAALGVGKQIELRLWAFGNVSACLGLALGVQTGGPVFIHAVLSYGFMGLGQALVWRGLRRYCGQDLSPKTLAAVAIASMALPAYFVWAEPSLTGRLVVSGLGFAALDLACLVTLVRGVRDRTRPVMWVAAVGFAILSAALILRALWLLMHGDAPADQELVTNGTLFVIPLAQVCIAFGLVLMITRRYAEELRRLALTDRLTGAYNRAGLDSLGLRMLQRARPLGPRRGRGHGRCRPLQAHQRELRPCRWRRSLAPALIAAACAIAAWRHGDSLWRRGIPGAARWPQLRRCRARLRAHQANGCRDANPAA